MMRFSTRNKKQRADVVPASTSSKVKSCIVKAAFDYLLEHIKSNGGSCNYGDYKETIYRYHELGNTWLKQRHLNYRMERHKLSKNAITSST
jgi:hypothetical protein